MESIISTKDFRSYIQYFDDDKSISDLLEEYLLTAQGIVENYLGYPLEVTEYKRFYSGTGQDRIYLDVAPIQEVSSIKVNDTELDLEDLIIEKDSIISANGKPIFPSGLNNIEIEFRAGYTDDESGALVRSVIMRIAALLWTEGNGNIGITGRSGADGSKTFVSFSNYDKYLKELKVAKGHYF